MRILLLAPIHKEKEYLKQKSKLDFLRGQGQQSWVEALRKLGHQTFVFKYSDSIIIPNIFRIYFFSIFLKSSPKIYFRIQRVLNKFYFLNPDNFLKNLKLLKMAEKSKPQVVIISGGVSNIYPSTILKIKNKYNPKVYLFSGVNPDYASTAVERKMIKEKIIDCVVENDIGYGKKWKKFGAKQVMVLPISSVDPNLHKRINLNSKEKKEYESDICFVGMLTPDRQKKLVKLLRFNLKIWGDIPPGIDLLPQLKLFYKGEAFGEKMVRIFNASKIALNFQPRDMEKGGNMRSFEIPGCGVFQLADKIDQNWFRNRKEVVVFSDLKDLERKIFYYLRNQNQREKIARSGFVRAHKYHTYIKHFKNLIKQIQ